jgi:glycerophosphoryl diester phosphodiesterase
MLRIGHRGAAAVAPENTIASFRRAVALGAQAVELDVQRTRDGHLIVMHDETVDRTTDGIGRVAELDLAWIQRLDAGSWKGPEFAGERVPTLDEVIDAIAAPTILFVELKGPAALAPGIEEDLLRVVGRARSRVRVSSFDHRALARLRELDGDLPLGALFTGLPVDPVALARGCGATAIHPSFHYVVPDLVAEAHAAGLEVHAWTVNVPEDIAAVRALGVDGIFSDHPDRLG